MRLLPLFAVLICGCSTVPFVGTYDGISYEETCSGMSGPNSAAVDISEDERGLYFNLGRCEPLMETDGNSFTILPLACDEDGIDFLGGEGTLNGDQLLVTFEYISYGDVEPCRFSVRYELSRRTF